MDARYVELAGRIGLGQSERIARLFGIIANQNEAELLLALPGNARAMAEKLGRSQEEIASMLQTLFVKGIVFPSGKTEPPTYRMSRDLIQFHDASILWPDAPQEFLDLWQDFMEIEWPEVAKTFSKLMPRPFTRVIPVGVTVQAKTHVLAFEDIKEIVEKARSISVSKCTCRLTAHKCHKKLEACLQVNKAADYNIARGTGRKLSVEEALEIVRQAEEDGLIHVVMNKQNVDNFICNCCPCCCQTMPVLIKHNIRVIEPSRFAAEIDPNLCTSCATCLERCYFGAISLEENEPARVEGTKCIGCGLCQVTCPSEAISMVEVRERDFVPEKLFG
jgi:Pyruvate/2-oxoacid:ferredoxin oxidoreductase delta subunit/DNA-binding Lrp family transcriptional regulator